MKNNCKDCGCKDTFLPVAPCSDPALCPSPQKCDETFDTDCVVYNGPDIDCHGDTIVNTGDSVSTILQSIVDLACDILNPIPELTIIGNTDNTVTCIPSGGVGPYTYQWSIEQGSFNGHTITSGATSDTLVLARIPDNKLMLAGISPPILSSWVYSTHLKVVVTDSVGAVATKFYTYVINYVTIE